MSALGTGALTASQIDQLTAQASLLNLGQQGLPYLMQPPPLHSYGAPGMFDIADIGQAAPKLSIPEGALPDVEVGIRTFKFEYSTFKF